MIGDVVNKVHGLLHREAPKIRLTSFFGWGKCRLAYALQVATPATKNRPNPKRLRLGLGGWGGIGVEFGG
jgi:hypothetical protein